jgi:hypothetical protein
MNDSNNVQNQQYEASPMQTDNNDLNNILAQMPTPVSNNIRASSDANSFMSPLQVDQQGYERLNGVRYSHQGNEEVCQRISNRTIADVSCRCSLHLFCLPLSLPWMSCVIMRTNQWLPLWIQPIFRLLLPLLSNDFLPLNRILAEVNPWLVFPPFHQTVDLARISLRTNVMFVEIPIRLLQELL